MSHVSAFGAYIPINTDKLFEVDILLAQNRLASALEQLSMLSAFFIEGYRASLRVMEINN
jgi:hypothetical protein